MLNRRILFLMRTTIQIPDALLSELVAATKAKTKTSAILQAIRFYVQRQEMARLKRLSGKIRIELDWKALEELELKGHARPR